MSDTGLTIKIGSTADTKGFDQATDSLHRSTEAAREFVDTLKLGVGIDLGGKLVESIREIPALLREAVAEGVKFNALMQSSQIAIAGGFKSMDASLSFEQAKQQGGEAIDYLMQKSKQMGLDFEAVVETFKVNVPTMFAAGIHDAKEMADTIILLNQVASSKGISGFQAQRDIIDLLNGMGERTMLGKELTAQGVSNESIEKWKEAGTLAENLREKFAAVAEAGAAAANTYDGSLNTLKTTWAQLLGDLSKPVFEELQQAFKDLAKELDSPEARKGLEELGYDIRDLVKLGVGIAEWAVKNAGNLALVAEAAGLLGVALGAIKLGDLVIGMTGMAASLSRNTALWTAETAAVEANTVAKVANAGAGVAAAATGGGGKLNILANGLTAAAPLAGRAAVAAEGAAVAGAATAGGLGAAMTGLTGAVVAALPVIVALAAAFAAYKAATTWDHSNDKANEIYSGEKKFGGNLSADSDLVKSGKYKAGSRVEFDRNELIAEARSLKSVEEQAQLLDKIALYKRGIEEERKGLGMFDGPKKESLRQEYEHADLIEKQALSTSAEKMAANAAAKAEHDKELTDKQAEEKRAAEEEKNRQGNAKREEARKEADAEREARLGNEAAIAQSKSASERGEYSTYARDREAELQKQLESTPSFRDEDGWEGKYSPQEVDKRDKLRGALEADIKQMAKAQEQADMDVWKERTRREEEAWKEQERRQKEATKQQIDDLKEKERLAQAQAHEKIATIEASGAKENEIAERRKQVEDELARKRLDIENQIGELEGESATARQTRQAEFNARKIARDHEKPKTAEAPKDLENYTVDYDMSGHAIAYHPMGTHSIGEEKAKTITMPRISPLDEFKARNGLPDLPPPATNPSSPPTAVAAAGTGGGGGAAGGGAASDASSAAKSLQQALEEQMKKLTEALTKASSSTSQVGGAAVAAVAAMQKQIDDLKAQLDRLGRA